MMFLHRNHLPMTNQKRNENSSSSSSYTADSSEWNDSSSYRKDIRNADASGLFFSKSNNLATFHLQIVYPLLQQSPSPEDKPEDDDSSSSNSYITHSSDGDDSSNDEDFLFLLSQNLTMSSNLDVPVATLSIS